MFQRNQLFTYFIFIQFEKVADSIHINDELLNSLKIQCNYSQLGLGELKLIFELKMGKQILNLIYCQSICKFTNPVNLFDFHPFFACSIFIGPKIVIFLLFGNKFQRLENNISPKNPDKWRNSDLSPFFFNKFLKENIS